MLDQRLSTVPQHQWVSKLIGYDFNVEYRPGRLNTVADALSRRGDDAASLNAISAPSFQLYDELRHELQEDPALRAFHDGVAAERGAPWRVVDGLVLHGSCVAVPESSAVLPAVLQLAHTSHEGIQKTLQRLRRDFVINHDRRLVQEHVSACSVCQRNKTEALHPAGLLQPLEVPSQVWADISLDFIEGLPRVNGKSVILTVVDRFSKYAHFIPLSHPYTAATVTKAFFDAIVRLHGFPVSIVSDRDPVFTGHVWRDLFKMAGVQLRMSTAFHPQTDASRRLLTKLLLCISGVSLVIGRANGWSGFLGPNTAIILRTTRRCAQLRLRSSMVGHLLLYCHIQRGRRPRRQWMLSSETVTLSSLRYGTVCSKLKPTPRSTTTPSIDSSSTTSTTRCFSTCSIAQRSPWSQVSAAS